MPARESRFCYSFDARSGRSRDHSDIYIDPPGPSVPLQSLEAAKLEITHLAEQIFYESNPLPADVTLFFNLSKPPSRKERQSLSPERKRGIANAVAQTVLAYFPPEGGSVELECRIGSAQLVEVDLILVNRVHPFDNGRWSWTEAGRVHKDARRHFQTAIAGKAPKLPKYLKSCDKCWLLIVAPSFRPSGMIRPDKETLENIYASPFDRTYFMDFGHGSVTQLKTVPSSD